MNKTTNKFSLEIRAGTTRMVLDHRQDCPSRWAAVVSMSVEGRSNRNWLRRLIGDRYPELMCRPLL